MSLREILHCWQDFWFKPQSPLSLALFRIAFGFVFLTQIFTQDTRDFSAFFGAHSMIPYQDFIAYWWHKDLLINLFEFVPAQSGWHMFLLIIMTITALMMTIGLFTRFSTFVTSLLFCSMAHQFPFFCNAGDDMQRVLLFLLFFSRAGDALSVDCIIGKPRQSWSQALFDPVKSAPWAQRLIQVQVSIAYLSTALLKINSDPWFQGGGVYYATRLNDFTKFSVPFLLDHLWPLHLLAWSTICLELSMGTLVWIKEFRYWILLLGLLFHLGIDWTMNIPIFEFVFISTFILFIEPTDLRRLAIWLNNLSRGLFIKWRLLRSTD